ncbi:MAG: class I SAM-dependent methyltransferase [Ignavibacteriales bacterium]|nr:class I SAM-dependent methyltransferase [Ignavibacteriales bacterium]
MKSKTKNPWLQISAEDYEGHMSAPNVAQLQMLNKIFADVLNEFNAQSIAVLGCTTGNGFEHLVNKNIERVVGVDINPDYISICKNRFEKSLPQLELICADLNQLELQNSSLHLIHTALILVEPEELRGKAKKCGLEEVKNYKIKLESGKSFLVNKYVLKD